MIDFSIDNQQSTIDNPMATVTVCVGSSCHVKGARDMIMRFSELLKQYNCEDKIELKGSFCMDRCGEGINWQINNELVTSSDVESAVKTFKEKVLEISPSSPSTGYWRSAIDD